MSTKVSEELIYPKWKAYLGSDFTDGFILSSSTCSSILIQHFSRLSRKSLIISEASILCHSQLFETGYYVFIVVLV